MADCASPGNTSPVNLPRNDFVCPRRETLNQESHQTPWLPPEALARPILS